MIPYAQRNEPDNVVTLSLFANLPTDLHVYICTGYVDLRKSIDGFISITLDDFGLNPFAKTIFCFCGRRSDRAKFLFYDGNCFMMMLRRMENIRFQWPRKRRGNVESGSLSLYKTAQRREGRGRKCVKNPSSFIRGLDHLKGHRIPADFMGILFRPYQRDGIQKPQIRMHYRPLDFVHIKADPGS